MNHFYLIFFFLVLCSLNGLIKGDNDPYSVPKAYSYGYTVFDDYSGSNYRVTQYVLDIYSMSSLISKIDL